MPKLRFLDCFDEVLKFLPRLDLVKLPQYFRVYITTNEMAKFASGQDVSQMENIDKSRDLTRVCSQSAGRRIESITVECFLKASCCHFCPVRAQQHCLSCRSPESERLHTGCPFTVAASINSGHLGPCVLPLSPHREHCGAPLLLLPGLLPAPLPLLLLPRQLHLHALSPPVFHSSLPRLLPVPLPPPPPRLPSLPSRLPPLPPRLPSISPRRPAPRVSPTPPRRSTGPFDPPRPLQPAA